MIPEKLYTLEYWLDYYKPFSKKTLETKLSQLEHDVKLDEAKRAALIKLLDKIKSEEKPNDTIPVS